MYRIIYALVFCTLICGRLISQNVSFQNVYGTASPEDAADLVKCQNGDFLIVGNTMGSSQQNETELLRVDNMGNVLWSKKLSTSVLKGIVIRRGIQTLNGGFCFVGNFTDTPPQDSSYLAVLKTDGNGQVLWTKQLEGPLANPNEFGLYVSEASDSSLYVCGYLFPVPANSITNPFVAKFSGSGQIKWLKQINIPSARAVCIMTFGVSRIYIGISDYSLNAINICQFDSSGLITQTLSMTESGNNFFELIDFTYNSYGHGLDLIVTQGATLSPTGAAVIFVDTAISTALPSESGFFKFQDTIKAAGILYNSVGNPLYFLQTSSSYGNTLILDEAAGPTPLGWIIDTLNKSIPCRIQSGANRSEYILSKKLSLSGTTEDFVFTRTYNGTIFPSLPDSVCFGKLIGNFGGGSSLNFNTPIVTTNNYLSSTTVLISAILSAAVIIPMTTDCFVTGIEENGVAENNNLFPNPSNGTFQLKGNFPSNSQLHIYNLFGEETIQPISLPQGNQTIPVELSLAEGIYIYRIISGKNVLHEEKLVIVK